MRCSQRALLSRWLLFYARARFVRATLFPSSYVLPSPHHAAIAPAAPVAELGVVRRLRLDFKNTPLWRIAIIATETFRRVQRYARTAASATQ